MRIFKSAKTLLLTSFCATFFIAACSGSGSSKPVDTGNQQQEEEEEEHELATLEQQEPTRSVIQLVNPGAESNSGSDGSPVKNPGTYGWDSSGVCNYNGSRVAAGNGKWRFQLGADCSIYQMTSHHIISGSAYSLIFDASTFAGLPPSVVVEFYVSDADGTQQTIAAKEFAFRRIAQNDWFSYQLPIVYGELDAHAGKRLGIKFRNASKDNIYLSVDNIELEHHESAPPPTAEKFRDSWATSCDQVWAGQSYWANRLQDWQVEEGKLKVRLPNVNLPRRTIHRVTSVISTSPTDFSLSVVTGSEDGTASAGSFSGFLLGAGFRLDHQAAAMVHNRHGKNGGLIVGLNDKGQVFIRDNDINNANLAIATLPSVATTQNATLELNANYQADNRSYLLSVIASDASGNPVSSTSASIDASRVLGSIGLVSQPGGGGQKATRHWFNDFSGSGNKLIEVPARSFGPVLFSAYTVSRNLLTLQAQLPSVCATQYQNAQLHIKQDGSWIKAADTVIDPTSFTAQFRVGEWDDTVKTSYRVAVDEVKGDLTRTHYYGGTIQADPKSKSEIVIGAYTCRPGIIINDEGWMQMFSNQPFTWTRERLVYPHSELMQNSAKHNNDLLVFTGDQFYEFDPNGLVDTSTPENLKLDYFYKWYQFGWTVRDYTRVLPSIIIPDDHDVFQPNVWGENGRFTETDSFGGYVHPAEFVRVVDQTQTGNLPPPYDPTPIEQNIGVYYTDLVYGRIGIAVLEDRKFKTGPNSERENKILLGDRQHAFLDDWAGNWAGQQMKLAISQSPFAMATSHTGAEYKRSGPDYDSNGWPKAGRDEAVVRLRRAFAPHINGDQHLGVTLKQGVENPRDAIYSFSVPSMMNVFPRIWDPQNQGNGPGDRTSVNTGSFTDLHGNYIDVLAAANADNYYNFDKITATVSKFDLGTGYGIIRINKPARTYTFEAWPINADPADKSAKPYLGWPITVKQDDNDGRNPVGYLPRVTAAVATPVIHVIDETTDELVYAKRLTASDFNPPVYRLDTTYTVRLSDPETGYEELLQGLSAASEGLIQE